MAEREGFEPSVVFSYARFPGVCLKPLSHLSAQSKSGLFLQNRPAKFDDLMLHSDTVFVNDSPEEAKSAWQKRRCVIWCATYHLASPLRSESASVICHCPVFRQQIVPVLPVRRILHNTKRQSNSWPMNRSHRA